MMKKLLATVLTGVMLLTNIPTASATIDTTGISDWALEGVTEAIEKEYVPKHLQSNYKENITREEFAELMVTAIFEYVKWDKDEMNKIQHYYYDFDKLTPEVFLSKISTTNYFTDTDNKYIKVANILGIINGVGNHLFEPKELITREQASIMFMNYIQTNTGVGFGDAEEKLQDLDEISDWAYDAVRLSFGLGIMRGTRESTIIPEIRNEIGDWVSGGDYVGDGLFSPKDNITREQAILVVSRVMGIGVRMESSLNLRGYVGINSDEFMSDFEIDGDTVKMLNSEYDNPVAHVKQFYKTPEV